MLVALAVLSFCAQSCEKDNFGKLRKHKQNDWNLNDSTSNDSTKNGSNQNDSNGKGSNGNGSNGSDSTDNDSTGRDSGSNDSTGNGGKMPGFFKESFMDSSANTYDVMTYSNPITLGGIHYYHRSHNVYEWLGSGAPQSVSNLKKINSYTENDLYFWNNVKGIWMRK